MVPPPDPIAEALAPVGGMQQPTEPIVGDQHGQRSQEEHHRQAEWQDGSCHQARSADPDHLEQAELGRQVGVAESVDEGRAKAGGEEGRQEPPLDRLRVISVHFRSPNVQATDVGEADHGGRRRRPQHGRHDGRLYHEPLLFLKLFVASCKFTFSSKIPVESSIFDFDSFSFLFTFWKALPDKIQEKEQSCQIEIQEGCFLYSIAYTSHD